MGINQEERIHAMEMVSIMTGQLLTSSAATGDRLVRIFDTLMLRNTEEIISSLRQLES